MAKIITDDSKIKNLLERGVENIFVKEELEKKLKSGKKLTVYLGIDPTDPQKQINTSFWRSEISFNVLTS
jgi:exonuclease VII large subunit